jgi:hypothetical protein
MAVSTENTGALKARDSELRTLVVTGPARDLLYEHFSRLYWGRGVVVVKDRRDDGERRAGRSAVAEERREADRRRRPPDWIVPPPDAA